MKNPMVYYGILAIGVVALAAGVYLYVTATAAAPHHLSAPGAVAVGAILLIAGVVGMVVMKPKAATK
jgi:hypothetical protein